MRSSLRWTCLCVTVLSVASVVRGDTLVGIENITLDLYAIDPLTGATALIGATGIPSLVYGAAESGVAGYVFANTITQLFLVDASNAQSTLVNDFSGDTLDIREIAYDQITHTLYGTNYANLYQIDPATAQTSLIGAHGGGISALWALTVVPGVGMVGVSAGNFYQFSTTTGAGMLLGPTGTTGVLDLAYDPTTGILIGGNQVPNLYSFDQNTGASTLIGPGRNMLGLARVSQATVELFRRGDANGDGSVNLLDGIVLLNYLFVPGSATPSCQDAADLNDSGSLSLPDVVLLLNYLFVPGSPPPVAPGPISCGPDQSADSLPVCNPSGC